MSDALQEIRSVTFRITTRSGYDVIDVDEFIDRIEQHVTSLIQQNRQLQDEVERLRQRLPG